ncbi:MAG: PH domain-containing protein [Actinomycetota bacterium]|nr:PH domain-containing protein [Actinomycetota bacterium]
MTAAGGPMDAAFRPRRARAVAVSVAVVSVVLFGGLGALVPTAGPPDRVGIAAFGLAIAWFMWRYASLAAVPSAAGLRVRNLLTTRDLDWAEIVSVHLQVGAPWVTLDLDDGDSLAVMAIQKADGERGRAEASRLAGLVAAHAAPEPPTG